MSVRDSTTISFPSQYKSHTTSTLLPVEPLDELDEELEDFDEELELLPDELDEELEELEEELLEDFDELLLEEELLELPCTTPTRNSTLTSTSITHP